MPPPPPPTQGLNLEVPALAAPKKAASQLAATPTPAPQPVRFLANNVSISVSSPVSPVDQPSPPALAAPAPPQSHARTLKTASTAPSTSAAATAAASTTNVNTNTPTPTDSPEATAAIASIAAIAMRRLVLRRIFSGWRWHAKNRHYKKLAGAKDEQIMYLLSKLDESSAKRVTFCQRARARRLLVHWRAATRIEKEQKRVEAAVVAIASQRLQARVLRAWREAARDAAAERDSTTRAASHRDASVLGKAMRAWLQRTADAKRRARDSRARRLHGALCAWRYASHLEARGNEVARMAGEKRAATVRGVIQAWRQAAARAKDLDALDRQMALQAARRRLVGSWQAWRRTAHARVSRRLLEQAVFSIETIKELYADNKRLAKVLDASLSVAEQVGRLRAASDENEKLLRRVLSIVEQPFGGSSRGRVSSRQKRADAGASEEARCPEVFKRLAAGKRERGGNHERRGGGGDGCDGRGGRDADDDCRRGGGTGTGRGEASGKGPGDDGDECTRDPMQTMALETFSALMSTTKTVCVDDAEFFALVAEVTRAFEQLGWRRCR